MFTSILTHTAAVMAENHVFLIRQEQIRSEKGTRTPLISTVLCLFSTVSLATASSPIENAIDLHSPLIGTSSDFIQLNKPFTIKCTANGKYERPLVDLYLPDDGFFQYYTEDDTADETKRTKVVLCLLYKKPKESFITIRCASRLKNSPHSLLISRLNIKIYYNPELVNSHYQWESGVGGRAVFHCNFHSNPIGTIQWYRNDSKLDPDGVKATISQSTKGESQSTTLTITDIVYKDYAKYSCLCENQIGNVLESFQIQNDYGRLNDSCLDQFDCHLENSFCNFKSRSCQCKNGYKQPLAKSEKGEIIIPLKYLEKCVKVVQLNGKCTSNDDCINKYAICNSISKTCQCISNFIAIKTEASNTCHPMVLDLFDDCTFDEQCRVKGSKCIDNFCFCDDFHKPYWKNGSCINKTFLYSFCDEDLCQKGGFAHSVCVNNSCRCFDGYYYNRLTHHCEGYDVYGICLFIVFIVAVGLVNFVFFYR